MINTTDHLVYLLEGDKLDKEVREALTVTEQRLRSSLESTAQRTYVKEAFKEFLGEENRRSCLMDETFIDSAFRFACSESVNTNTQSAMVGMAAYTHKRNVSASRYSVIKRGLKVFLVELWKRRALLLPTIFAPGPGFNMSDIDHEIINWLQRLDPTSSDGVQGTSLRRMYYYGPRLVFATNWCRVEDVSLADIAELHTAQLKFSKGLHEHPIAGSQFPWSQLPAEMLLSFPDRVSFTKYDLIRYSAWTARCVLNPSEQEAFVLKNKALVKERKKARQKLAYRLAYQKRREFTNTTKAYDVRQASTHEAILAVFRRYQQRPISTDWRRQVPVYPGREHVDNSRVAQSWIKSFTAFLYHREHIQRYRSSRQVISSLNILADYLFLYLPWWRELHANADVEVPPSPKYFTRYAYVSRHSNERVESLPMTLIDMVRLRRQKAESAASCIKHLHLFFRFVETHFRDDQEVAGEKFRNPMDDEFDTPRIPGRKNKTNKEVIPRNIYGHLLFYCYAVEEFGSRLLSKAINGDFNHCWRAMRGKARYRTEEFGLTPLLRYQGRMIPLHSVPNVFTWAEREIVDKEGPRKVALPHMTALRLLIVSLETGLRCQSVQWLDRVTWDSLNINAGKQYTYRLLVNTDKTKVDAWSPPIVYRVRQVLQREVDFQKLFLDFEKYEPVAYEGCLTSPFDPVRPLFRSSSSGKPIRDDVYYDAWLALQVDFQGFYISATGERHVRLYNVKPLRTPDGEPVVKYVGRNADAYCAISIRPVHTPHACRATFATNRQGQGILELSDVAQILGHEGVATTSHYTKFSNEQLQERLHHSDIEILGDYVLFDVSAGSAYVRPDKSDSALRRSFSKDREGTVSAFGFMPSISLWSIQDDKAEEHDGLNHLKNGPMSHIRFRETHICPVGEECPADIVRYIGVPKRCGICPLAMKCIDHLPAISAKRNQLVERIRYLHAQRNRMEKAGEPLSTLDAIWDEIQLDVNELLGWTLSEEILNDMHAKASSDSAEGSSLYVERPDIVRRHLQRVTRQSNRTEFLLQRLAESNAYPSMTSPQLQTQAALIRRKFSAGQGLETIATLIDDGDDVAAAASMLKTMMKSSGLSLNDAAELLSAPARQSTADAILLDASALYEK